MRIIAGKDAGRNLFFPEGKNTRPTSDRVKESLFSIIQNDIHGSICLDLFSASGSIGLELLSRGADFVYFCDKDYNNIKSLKKNVELLDYHDCADISKADFRTYLKKKRFKDKLDIVFLDPPYDLEFEYEALKLLHKFDLLSDKAVVIVESTSTLKIDEISHFTLIDERKYGKVRLSFLKEENNDSTLSR